MKFNFWKWVIKRPENPLKHFATLSNVAILFSMMFLIFGIAHRWNLNPYKIMNTSDLILIPYITIWELHSAIGRVFNSVLYGPYDFVFKSMNFATAMMNFIAFWGVVVAGFGSLLLGALGGFLARRKGVIALYLAMLAIIFSSIYLFNVVVAYALLIVATLIVNFVIIKKSKDVL